MGTLLAIVGALTIFVAVYAVILRPIMRTRPWGQRILATIEPIERILWWNSETKLWSRFKAALGAFLTALVVVDWTAIAPILPDSLAEYRWILLLAPQIFLFVDGLIGDRLRDDVTKPKELVALRTDAPLEVKEAVAEAAAANARAVDLAKQTGAV